MMEPRQVLAMAAALASVASVSAAQSGSGVVPFAPVRPGATPADFQVARTGRGAPAAWSVVADSKAQGGQVLIQTSTDQTDYRFPLAIYGGLAATNVEVTVRFKAVGGRIDRAGGIAVRLADPNNYYVLRANALEDNVNFYRVVQGSRREIHGVSAKVTSEQWHTLSLRAEGDRFTVGFDGATLFTATDQTFSGAGKVALWTKADSVTQFDALTIKALP
jgi:glycosyl hydrolase family 59 (putative galactocerebrosidase)